MVDLAELMIAASERGADALRKHRDLEAVAAELVARGRAAWPNIRLEPREFVAHVARQIDDADDVAATLSDLHAGDLWLAFACGRGNRLAISELDQQLGSIVAGALARMKDKIAGDDVSQVLREKLLVGKRGAPPKILEYSGRGPLGGWIRIAAVRTALSLSRHGDAAGMQPVTREVLLGLPATSEDPEMAHLRKRYARDFKRAFEDALAELSAEDRNILRLSLVDGLSIDEIGLVFGVHRATAARHLARCREGLMQRTCEILSNRLELGVTDLRSMMGYIRSQLDLSIQRLLTDGVARTPKKSGARKKSSSHRFSKKVTKQVKTKKRVRRSA